ncbi:hypothetical protein MUK72_19185 (plasmid) [Halococcus dombrowskii]|uniref:CcmD family protein n=1 Tax=Halococcus dombrowskii TaxID=179637 RepID=A0AAV3SGK7_HALDO|nr:hypothetical protein [Halococcus dombrowskii]UOO97277.1 hypothetical protein MUK72_19185 [Halococcus dombrowskii]
MAAETVALVYWGGLVVLFFFWAYGIVSFLLDIKNKIVPGIVQYRRGRRQLEPEQAEKSEREEQERELY